MFFKMASVGTRNSEDFQRMASNHGSNIFHQHRQMMHTTADSFYPRPPPLTFPCPLHRKFLHSPSSLNVPAISV